MPKPPTTSTNDFPPWYRTISAAGVTTLLVAIGCGFGFWHWLEALGLPGLAERTYEFFNAPGGITWGRAAIFAASLVLANALRYKFDADLRRRRLINLRRVLGSIRRVLRTSTS